MAVKAKAKLASEGSSPQRVSPSWSPLLLQSPHSRTGLAPQATTSSRLKTKLFLATLRVLKRNIPAFSLRIREFSPKL